MSDISSYEVGPEPRVMVSSHAADLTVTVGDAGMVHVHFPSGGAEQYRIQHSGDRVTVRRGDRKSGPDHISIEVTVPEGTELKLSSASGDVDVRGAVGDVDISLASGDVHVDGATGGVRVKSASGDIEIGDSPGAVDATTVSGDVRLATAAGAVNVTTASGDVRIAAVDDICAINSVSGAVTIYRCDATDTMVRTMSGDVVIGLPPRRLIELDFESIAGDIRNQVEPGDGGSPERTIVLRCRSVSGDLTLRSCE